MILRESRPEDWKAMKAVHGGDFPLPEPDSRILAAQVVEHEGRPIGLVVAVRAAEIVMVLDRGDVPPAFRWAAVGMMQEGMQHKLEKMHVDSGYCWLAPQYSKSFGKRLMRFLGWTEPQWRCLQWKVMK